MIAFELYNLVGHVWLRLLASLHGNCCRLKYVSDSIFVTVVVPQVYFLYANNMALDIELDNIALGNIALNNMALNTRQWHSARLCMIPTECNKLFAYGTVIIFPFTILSVMENFLHSHTTLRTACLVLAMGVVF